LACRPSLNSKWLPDQQINLLIHFLMPENVFLPENVYLGTKISSPGGLEDEIL
jgi:energy-converting hydrogenase Eha subunit F